MFAGGVEEEVARVREETLSRSATQIIGLREIRELPREEAVAAIELRTRRYVAYQRKWMRRIPALTLVPADRSADETAADILAALDEP
jgi:tRNA A37 N6-isopentenylltransferase MiaA